MCEVNHSNCAKETVSPSFCHKRTTGAFYVPNGVTRRMDSRESSLASAPNCCYSYAVARMAKCTRRNISSNRPITPATPHAASVLVSCEPLISTRQPGFSHSAPSIAGESLVLGGLQMTWLVPGPAFFGYESLFFIVVTPQSQRITGMATGVQRHHLAGSESCWSLMHNSETDRTCTI